MVRFGVIAGIGDQPQQAHDLLGFVQQRLQFVHVGAWPAIGQQAQDEVGLHVADETQLRVTMINDGFPGARDAIPPPHEIGAGTGGLHAGGVGGGGFDAPLSAVMLPHRRVQELAHAGKRQQTPRSFLQRGEVRNAAQLQQLAKRRMIGQMGHHTSIIRLQEVLQHQTGEQLMLGELLGAATMRVRRQRAPRHGQRRQHNLPRRFTGNSHILRYVPDRASRLS